MTTSVVTFVVRKGNPKNIKTWDDLLKPGVKVLTPNPFTSGAAKWNLLAAYGAGRRRRQGPAGGPGLRPQAAHGAREGAGQVRPRGAAELHVGRRRRAPVLRVRGDHRQQEGRGPRLRASRTTRSRSTSTSRRPRTRRPQAKQFLDYVLSDPAQERFASWGYRPVERGGPGASTPTSSRPRPACSRSRTSAAGRRSTTRCSIPRRARSPRSRRTRGCRPPSERDRAPQFGSVAAPGQAALGRPRPRHRDAVAQHHRAAAALGRRRAGVRRRPGHVLGRRENRQAVSALTFTVGVSLVAAAVNAVMGTLLAWVLVRDRFRGKAARQRVRRPALRAADDRRRPDAARALRTQEPDRRQRRVHAVRGAARAAVRDDAVRGPRRPAGPDRARSRDGGGGAVARRVATGRSSAAIILPNLVPALLSGAALAFARAVGEFGSVILISGNIPFETQVASVYAFKLIESDDADRRGGGVDGPAGDLAGRAHRDPRPRTLGGAP